MNRDSFFSFEDKNMDFPYYKNKMLENRNNLIILLTPIILFIILTIIPINFPDVHQQSIYFLVTFIPMLLLTKCRIGTFFRKPSLNDLRLVIVSYIGYEIFYLIMAALFSLVHFQTTHGDVSGSLDLLHLFTNILQIIGEELFKAFLFILSMYIIYKYTKNRKKSVMLSAVIVLFVFGLMHVNTYNYNIIQILLMQGLGSIFDLFTYIKTKNLTVSLLLHILIDVSYWIMLLS